MKFLRLLVLLLFLTGTLRAKDYEALVYKAPDGQTLPYRLLSPEKVSGKVPLVIFLHGAGERGDNNQWQLRHGAPLFAKPDVQEKFPCYVLAPQCPTDQKWVDWDWKQPFTKQPAEPSAPMKLVLAVLDTLLQEHQDIDTDRIYVTGLSMGGYGTWDLATRFPDRFAAIAPICGGGDPEKAAAIAKVPTWTFHGNADPVVTVEQTRRMVAAMEKAGARPLYTEYANVAHDSWSNAYSEPMLLPWMFAQHRGQPAVEWGKIAGQFDQPPTNLFPGDGPVQPGIWFRALWKQRRSDWAKSKDADQGAVVFLGDSITQGWNTLAKDFPDLKVANRGISGDTTRGVLFRLKEDVLDVKPRAVVLLIGTNDLGLGASPDVAAQNIRTILTNLRNSDRKLPVIVCKVMPSDPSKTRPADKIQRLNALVDQLVDADPLFVRVDTYNIFANEQGNAKKEEFPDLLHPNATGYAKWAEALRPVFEKLGIAAEPVK
ncbi:GDSL-type esterase/lipase family protein [Verrucomicrobiota bacterium sgz303538]